jgi:ribosomal protein S27AE
MPMKCPGQDLRNLRVSVHRCPNCGADVEMFSDELRVKCQKCGVKVYREQAPSCIDWCSHARDLRAAFERVPARESQAGGDQ